MKVVLISDTHNQHQKVVIPNGDIIIHAGDISGGGSYAEVFSFLQWFAKLPFKLKIFIAGNHDFLFEKQTMSNSNFPDGVIYLENSMVDIEGLKIYGSPYTPEFYNWAFMKKRGEEIRNIWNLIPANVDILVTHGPPYSVLDENAIGQKVGCEDLLLKVQDVKPKVHVFGHIHEGYGTKEEHEIKYVNASILNEDYRLVNKPIVIDV